MNILRTRQVIEATGLSRSSLWRYERDSRFPRRLRLGPNAVGWLESEIEEWLKSRPRGMTGFECDATAEAGPEAA